MDFSVSTPYTNLTKAAKDMVTAHQGVRAAIAEHAAKAAKDREQAQARLAAENMLKTHSA